MTSETITIRVDSEAARIYRDADQQAKRKLDLLMSLQIHRCLGPKRSLDDVMREASEQARKSGLTPEMLDDILANRT